VVYLPFIRKLTSIFIGSILVAIGINVFLVPFELLDGGALGIGLIFHYTFEVKVGFVLLLINIPIFICAWHFYRPFFYNGIHGMLITLFIIDLLYPLHVIGENSLTNPLLSAVLGGAFIGMGAGIMLRSDISVGGLDLLAQMLAKYINVNPGYIIFIIDLIVVSIGSQVLSSSSLILSITTVLSVGITVSLLVATKKKVTVHSKVMEINN
jgi:uncharacterized membrane-anchored protein YitT (DUF2179 family)